MGNYSVHVALRNLRPPGEQCSHGFISI